MKQIVQMYHGNFTPPNESYDEGRTYEVWLDTEWLPEDLAKSRRNFPTERYRLVTTTE